MEQSPIGHGTLAHGLFGWCAACPGRSPVEELREWRAWGFTQVVRAMRRLPTAEVPD